MNDRDCESCKKFSRNDPYESEGYCQAKHTWVDPQEGEDCKMHEFTLHSATKYKDGTPIMSEPEKVYCETDAMLIHGETEAHGVRKVTEQSNQLDTDYCKFGTCPYYDKFCDHTLQDKHMCPYLPHDTDSNLKYLEQTFTEFAKTQDELIEEYDATLKTHGDTLEELLDRIYEFENMYENVLEDLSVMKERLCKITSFVTDGDKYAHIFENFCGNCAHAEVGDGIAGCELSGEIVDPTIPHAPCSSHRFEAIS